LNLRIVVVSVLLFSVRLDLAGRLLAVQHAQPCCIMLVTQLAIAVGACARMGGHVCARVVVPGRGARVSGQWAWCPNPRQLLAAGQS